MKRVFLLILILLLAIFSGYFIYKSFSEYKNYLNLQNIEKSLVNFQDLDELLKRVENELSLSSIYIASDGKSDFSSLQIARDDSDDMVQKATLLEDKTKFKSDIRYARSRVDVISLDYKSIIFDYYQDEVAKSILHDMKKGANELFLNPDELKDYINSYIKLIEFRNSINKEKSFITYILKQSKKMSKDDLVLWDSMIEYQESFSINALDEFTLKEITKILQTSNIQDQKFANRVKIALGANRGEYSISSSEWLKNQDKLIDLTQQAKILVYDRLKQKLANITSAPEKVIIYIAITLILILVLFILIYKLAERDYDKKDIRISDDVLRARH